MRDFALKMMNFVLKMLNFVLQLDGGAGVPLAAQGAKCHY